MKLLVFSVYDEKAEFFSNPFFVAATGIATRMIADLANDPSTTISKHPNDFTLYHVGNWNNTEAKFDNLATPKFIARASEYTQRQEPPIQLAPKEEETA